MLQVSLVFVSIIYSQSKMCVMGNSENQGDRPVKA